MNQQYGGPIRAVLDLSHRALATGLESEVLGFGKLHVPDNPFSEHKIHCLPVTLFPKYCYSRDLHRWLEGNLHRFQGVVLHGMWLYPNWETARQCRAKKIPYACFPHGMLEPWSVYRQGLWKAVKKLAYWMLRERKIYDGAVSIFFTTKRELEHSSQTFRTKSTKWLLVPYGVDTSRKLVKKPAQENLTQPEGRRIGLFLGRVHPKKNVLFLVKAWAEAELDRNWHLVIAGSGPAAYLDEIRRLIGDLDLGGQVHLVGFVAGEDKMYLLQRAEWFLLPSRQENFGIAVLEAVANGCPVAISDQVYLAEVFHGEAEVLPLQLAAWVEFFRNRMVDAAWRERVRRLDETHVVEVFEIGRVAAEWASTLQSAFGAADHLRS